MILSLKKKARFARALHSRSFAIVWGGQTLSALGDAIFFTALAWQVLLLTGSATAMGTVMIIWNLAMLPLLLFGGIVADRFSRRTILFYTDLGRAILIIIVAWLGWMHWLQLWHLMILAALFGIANGFFYPAYQSLPPQLVDAEMLPSANALTSLGQQLSQLLGPVLGASLVGMVGPYSAFALDGLTFVISVLTLFSVKRISPTITEPTNSASTDREIEKGSKNSVSFTSGALTLVRDIREGFSYIISVPWLWVTIIVVSIGNIGIWGPLIVALPKLVHNVYGEGVWLLGVIGTASALGAMIAMLVIGQVQKLPQRGLLVYLSLILASLGLILFGLPIPKNSEVYIAPVANFLVGFGTGVFEVLWITIRQERVPSSKLGRVTSIDLFGSSILLPLGYILAGVFADRIGPGQVFIAGGILNVILVIIGLSIRDIRNLK